MQNDETNGSIETYLRDIALWNERVERQRLGIIGAVQRALTKIADDVEKINSSTSIKILMSAPEFSDALNRLSLAYTGKAPKTIRRKTAEAEKPFNDYISSLKTGEPAVRAEYVQLTGETPTSFDRLMKKLINSGKASKIRSGYYNINTTQQ